jgi:hypothetical protein
MKVWSVRRNLAQRLSEQIEPLLAMNSAEEEQDELTDELRVHSLKYSPRREIVKEAEIDAVRDETDRGRWSEVAQVANLRLRQRVQAGRVSKIPGFDECHVQVLFPALVVQSPRFGHPVSSDEIRYVCSAGYPGSSPRMPLPKPMHVHHVRRTNCPGKVCLGSSQ